MYCALLFPDEPDSYTAMERSHTVTDSEMDQLDAVFSDLTDTSGGGCGIDYEGKVLRITTADGTTEYHDSTVGCMAPFVDSGALNRAAAAMLELVPPHHLSRRDGVTARRR